MTSDLETRLRRYGETFERFVDAYPDDDVARSRVRRSHPRRLAAVRAAQVPPFSVATADDFARRRVTRRAPVVIAIAACLTVALVVGGWLLFSGSNDSPSVQTPAGAPTAGAAGGCAGKAYVTNVGDGTVSVITTATGAVSAPITVGKSFGWVAITPDGKHVYLTNGIDGTVSVLTTATGVVSAPIKVGGNQGGIAITPDGKHAYVTHYVNHPTRMGDGVSVLTTATGAVSAPITVGHLPHGVAITPDGKHAYVTNQIDGTVSVITTATGAVSTPITVGESPGGVAITPDGKHAYVTNSANYGVVDPSRISVTLGTVSVITTATGAVSAPLTVGKGPDAVAITPDGKHAYVTNNGDDTVSVITTATGAVSTPITVGHNPGGVAITPDGKHAYVTNNGDGTVSVITTATGAVSAPITVGKLPFGVAICPARSAHRRR
jgi:YVTN family beta-propeller protein